jgi:hypothetical protein
MGMTRTSLNGSSWSFSWIQTTQPEVPSTPNSLLSSRMDAQRIDDWIKWVMTFREIENLMSMKEPADKTRMFRTLLKSQALSYFEHHLMMRFETEDSDVPDNELIEVVFGDVCLEYIPKSAIRVQKYDMRHIRGLFKGLNTSVQQFVERLNDLNCYLLYFPEEIPKQLDQDEIIEILDQAKARDPE